MDKEILGIHHVTAIAGDPQANIDFYTGVLGLRLVKLTVNFDDPTTYHLYYGDGLGRPGTLMTFFPWPGAAPGRIGTGQVAVTSFAVPEGALEFWRGRIEGAAETRSPFGDRVLALTDPDGLRLEIAASRETDPARAWEQGPVPPEYAIRGFHRVTLSVEAAERTAALLTETMGLRETAREGARFRFEAAAGGAGATVDLIGAPEEKPGRVSVGTVHHVAWRTPDEDQQARWRATLTTGQRYNVTPVIDRKYFRSIYFREPGGVLFEIATDRPGMAVDEPANELGSRLVLPERLEASRAEIEKRLPPVRLPAQPHLTR
jgi:glyoxalase family protein